MKVPAGETKEGCFLITKTAKYDYFDNCNCYSSSCKLIQRSPPLIRNASKLFAQLDFGSELHSLT